MFRFAVALLCLVVAAQATTSPNLVTGLPYLNFEPNFDQYSGYITVNTTYERALFYWFVESQNDPATDPILLWLQGGPGCAGIWAMFEEHGPYRIAPNKTVYANDLSWNKKANIIFIDAPAGVGFSYSNTTEGLNTNDNQTAQDNYHFLEGFFEQFPQYSTNDLWITGESYGGVYVPTLVNEILTGNNTSLKNQLVGFTIGNPVINCPALQTQGMSTQIDMFYYHGLVSFAGRQKWYNESCDVNQTPDCLALYDSLVNSIGHFSGDDLYSNFCTGNGTLELTETVTDCFSLSIRTEWYLNDPTVQAALGVDKVWISCSFGILSGPHYTKYDMNMLDFYNSFFENAPYLRMMIYSGDVDIDTVPHSQTQLCLSYLARPTVSSWKAWTIPGPAIPNFIPQHEEIQPITAGYVEVYDTYTYATVKGAGHEVPLYQPVFAYSLFEAFIINGTAPS